ncbi:MAG: riboflavin synthase [Acidaminobacteraceae bacterium]
MFTGIIEEVGTVKSIKISAEGMELEVSSEKLLMGSKVGDSIAVNGVCITAKKIGSNMFIGDVMKETLSATSLQNLKANQKVNLETALTLSKPMGGHFVLGHVDTTGIISKIAKEGFAKVVDISYPSEFKKNLINKGSIAVDGVSLTIHKLTDLYLQIKLIPHSTSETNLSSISEGDLVNLEFDFLGKYALNMFMGVKQEESSSNISKSFLAENGFL